MRSLVYIGYFNYSNKDWRLWYRYLTDAQLIKASPTTVRYHLHLTLFPLNER